MDANGVGLGFIDFMTVAQRDTNGDVLPPFGIYNDKDGKYRKQRTHDTELDAIYMIKANAALNTEAHSTLQEQLNSGKIKFLIDERTAKAKLLAQAQGKKMTVE